MAKSAVTSNNLKDFIAFVCSLGKLSKDDFNNRISAFLDDPLRTTEEYKIEFSNRVNSIFVLNSLTDAGINSNLGFFPELKQRIKYRILPPINRDNFLSQFISELVLKKEDHRLLDNLSADNWKRLLDLASFDQTTAHSLGSELENALIILTHQYVSIGIDPYIVRKLPYTDDTDSPFFNLNVMVNEFVKGTKTIDVNDIFSSLEKCESVFNHLKENRGTLGISLHLTFLIRRAEQHSQRISLLLTIHSEKDEVQKITFIKKLAIQLTKAELNSNSIRYFVSENTGLLANRIANQTSSKGGDYIGFTKQANNKLMVSAMGGGVVVIILVFIKHYIHRLHLPLLPEGILFGLNYGLGFVFMHFAHLTLATKQPAMTASYIAESIEQKGLSKDSRKELSMILAQIMRSQFISLIGNLIVVLPLSYLLALALIKFNWYHVFTKVEAGAYLEGNHPLLSGSLFFAVLTGVFLTLAGLITGYYDNKVIFSSIPKRIVQHPFLKKIIPLKLLERMASLVSKHLGAIAGNMSLGFFLGLAGNLGKFIGLPFDIRHVTISSGNFAISLAQGYGFTTIFTAIVFFGIILIGIINIISSFMFSFLIACRSRYLSSQETWLVLFSMLGYIIRNPGILLFRKDQARSD